MLKNQHIGDIGDYGEYGLLRVLSSKGLKIYLQEHGAWKS